MPCVTEWMPLRKYYPRHLMYSSIKLSPPNRGIVRDPKSEQLDFKGDLRDSDCAFSLYRAGPL